MVIQKSGKSLAIRELLNGTISSLKTVVPIKNQIEKPRKLVDEIQLQYGVIIGFAGDVKGNLVFTGESNTFGSIAKAMYGMPLEGEMLESFSGELGNMIAGTISTNISKSGADINITPPTVLQGSTKLTGFDQALKLKTNFENAGDINTYLLLT